MRLTLLFLLSSILLFGQSLDQRIVKVPYFFDIDTITDTSTLGTLLDQYAVTKIVYHYSYYRLNPNFDQLKLNRDRKSALLNQYPQLKSKYILWKDSINYECNSPSECKDVFHGYTIYFQPGSSLTRKEELSLVDSMVLYLSQINLNKKKKSIDPKFMKSVWDDRVGWVPDTSSVFTLETEGSIKSKIPSVITNTMSRNKWSSYSFVVDITASMSKYYCDFLNTINAQFFDSTNVSICFFNDGDGKENHKKIIGSTGGLFFYEGYNLFDMTRKTKKHLFISSRDLQENDTEGLIKAQEKFKEAKELVLIADNHSPIRDFNLFRNVQKPVHIILCGGNEFNINTQYISLAFLTRGSIHTKGYDINIPSNLSPGETFSIGKATYEYLGFDDYSNPIFDRSK